MKENFFHHCFLQHSIAKTNRLRSILLEGFIFFVLLCAGHFATAQHKKLLPTIGQKAVQLFTNAEHAIFKKHPQKDSAATVSTKHHGHDIFSKIKDVFKKKKPTDTLRAADTFPPNLSVSTIHKNLHPSIEIFGYHPYWVSQESDGYIKEFLTTIAFVGWEVEPASGALINLGKSVSASSVSGSAGKTVMSVILYGANENKTFLTSMSAQQSMIGSLVTLVETEKLDGISIDFEELALANSTAFTSFIQAVSTALLQKNKDLQLSVAIPPLDPHRIFDVTKLAPFVDYFIVMAYNYYWKGSTTAGPNAPLISNKPWATNLNITKAIADLIARKVPSKKILLGVPYYGSKWKTKSLSYPSEQSSYHAVTYSQVLQKLGNNKPLFDKESLTEYYAYSDSGENYQLWFDGPRSLSEKYQFVIKNQLGGVAIWCLGYDHNTTDLWRTLVNSFDSDYVDSLRDSSVPDSSLLSAIDTLSTNVKNNELIPPGDLQTDSTAAVSPPATPSSVFEMIGLQGAGQIALVALLILSAFTLTGFILAMAGTKFAAIADDKLAVVYLAASFILFAIIVLLYITHAAVNPWVLFVTGAVAGIIITVMITRLKPKHKRLP